MDKQFNYAVYQEKLDLLTSKTRQLLIRTGNEKLARNLDCELNNETENKELRLAFVGQYSWECNLNSVWFIF